jgi:hypothetical protein
MSEGRPLLMTRIALTLRVRVAKSVLVEHLGKLGEQLGDRLAEQVERYVQSERPGYFPALNFFDDRSDVDPALLEAARRMAEVVGAYVARNIQDRLFPVFSSVSILQVKPLAYTMPHVAVSDPEAHKLLARHYHPNLFRVELQVSLLERNTPRRNRVQVAEQRVGWWLRDAFSGVDIVDARAVE